MGFSEIMASDQMRRGIDPRYREYAGDVLSSARHLLSIVDDLLDMAKVESGKFELRMEVVSVAELARDCTRMLQSRFDEARLGFSVALDPSADLVRGDHRILKQVLLNLLSNSLKFTPPGGRISITSRTDGELLAIAVTDTGIGMTVEQVRHATDLFFQADSSIGRKYGGTGLGLTLVRAFVERHGGTLSIESQPGRGTTVTARVPRAAAQAAPDPAHGKVVKAFPTPLPVPANPAATG
jgi:two-component system cell cycle sensor histidine kinase PleC